MTESRLWVLDRQVFQAIMMTTGIRRQEETMKFLRRWESYSSNTIVIPRTCSSTTWCVCL